MTFLLSFCEYNKKINEIASRLNKNVGDIPQESLPHLF